MPTQQRKSRKNYIGILSETVEGQRVTESLPKHGRPLKDYLLGLMGAVRDRDAGSSSSPDDTGCSG